MKHPTAFRVALVALLGGLAMLVLAPIQASAAPK